MIKILSLGAGVSYLGDLPRLGHAIFADTGWEPKAVYDHLQEFLRRQRVTLEEVVTQKNNDQLHPVVMQWPLFV